MWIILTLFTYLMFCYWVYVSDTLSDAVSRNVVELLENGDIVLFIFVYF
jgi:hypothetical protein